jgi:hypothetical protein
LDIQDTAQEQVAPPEMEVREEEMKREIEKAALEKDIG